MKAAVQLREEFVSSALSVDVYRLQQARTVQRLKDVLARADDALGRLGVSKKSPVRVNIKSALTL